jgi:phage baseplate assembly protein V
MDRPDIPRLVGDLMRLGTIESVAHAQGTCRMRIGDIVTGDLPWLAGRAGAVSIWSPPTVGEQCMLLCPEGDHEAGLVLPGLFSSTNPAAGTDADSVVIKFADGTLLRYDLAAHALEATIAAGGTVAIDAPGGVSIKGPVAIEGPVTINGKLTASDDVVADGKSLRSHKHSGVSSGGAVSGPPQ